MDNQIIQSFWYSANPNQNSISQIELLCIASYLHHNHIFHLYTYTPKCAGMAFIQEKLQNHKNFSNLIIKDAREILKEEEIFFDNRGKVGIAAFSDLFRFSLLYQKGGWWVDMDTICIQPFNFASPYVFATERIRGGGQQSATCIIKAPKDSIFLQNLLKEAHHIIKTDLEEVKRIQNTLLFKLKLSLKPKLASLIDKNRWGIIGPIFLQTLLEKNQEMQKYSVSPSCFCEINYWEAFKFITPNFNLPHKEEIYALHIWNAIWEDRQMNKENYPKDSLLQKIQEKYLP